MSAEAEIVGDHPPPAVRVGRRAVGANGRVTSKGSGRDVPSMRLAE